MCPSRSVWRAIAAQTEGRLCAAHAAVMVFGLVATLGVWRDSVHQVHAFLGVCAVIAALLSGGFVVAHAALRHLSLCGTVPDTRVPSTAGFLAALSRWYQHANRTAGAPPSIAPVFCIVGHNRGQASLALFLRLWAARPGAQSHSPQEVHSVFSHP